jgi:hypothetical protein
MCKAFEPEFGLVIRKCEAVVGNVVAPMAIGDVHEDFK